MGDYLERHAERSCLPVVTGDDIARLSRGPHLLIAQSERRHPHHPQGRSRPRWMSAPRTSFRGFPLADQIASSMHSGTAAPHTVCTTRSGHGDGATDRARARASREIVLATGRNHSSASGAPLAVTRPRWLCALDCSPFPVHCGPRPMRSRNPTPGLHRRWEPDDTVTASRRVLGR